MYGKYVAQSKNNFSKSILSPTISNDEWPFPFEKENFLETLSKRKSYRFFNVNDRQLTKIQLNMLANHVMDCLNHFQLQDLVHVCFIDQSKLFALDRGVYFKNLEDWEQKCLLTASSVEESLFLQKEMHRASGIFYFEWNVEYINSFNRLIDYCYMLSISGLLGHQLSLKASEMELKGTIFAGLTLIEYLQEIQQSRQIKQLPLFAFAIQ